MRIEFQSSISDKISMEILAELKKIEDYNDVRILFAVESGSRAWGFPSPDSDYDVRFIYARPLDWYLSITPDRDVIELPIENELDINGWDIKKALGLMLKPNPVMLEWLSSPIKYMWNEAVCAQLIEFSKRVSHGTACLNHYLHLGDKQWGKHIEEKDEVNLKKYFYIVRPAMAIRWLRLNSEVTPPMNFQALLHGINPDEKLTDALQALLLAKSQSKEIGLASRVEVIDEFITSELEWARKTAKTAPKIKQDLKLEADDLFRQIVKV